MKKRRYFAGAAAILFLLLLCGFAPQSITEDKDAQVLLYETYGESEILVYTGRTTVLYRPDGRSAEAPFNGQYAVLHGDTVTVFAETEEFLAVERFSAGTLEETDLFALPVTSGLRFAESDSAGRLYAVTYGAPSTLQVFDAAGEPLTEFIFEDKIFGIQTVDLSLIHISEMCIRDRCRFRLREMCRHFPARCLPMRRLRGRISCLAATCTSTCRAKCACFPEKSGRKTRS